MRRPPEGLNIKLMVESGSYGYVEVHFQLDSETVTIGCTEYTLDYWRANDDEIIEKHITDNITEDECDCTECTEWRKSQEYHDDLSIRRARLAATRAKVKIELAYVLDLIEEIQRVAGQMPAVEAKYENDEPEPEDISQHPADFPS